MASDGSESFPGYSATEAVDESFVEAKEGVYDSMSNVDRVISIYDFLRVPFSPSTNADDKEALDYFMSMKNFVQRRAALIRSNYFMDLSAYDRLHTKALLSLKRLAGVAGVPLGHNVVYSTILTEIEDAISEKKSSVSFAEVGAELSALHQSAYLFENRYTTMLAVEEDAMVLGLGDAVKQFASSIKTIFNQNSCKWCKAVMQSIIKGACGVASKFLCNSVMTILGTFSGGVLKLIGRFVCGWPINVVNILTAWCQRAVNLVKAKIGKSNACLCAFKLGFTIPSVSIPLSGRTQAVTIGSTQNMCNPSPSECTTVDAIKAAPKTSLTGKIAGAVAGGAAGKAVGALAGKVVSKGAAALAGKVAGKVVSGQTAKAVTNLQNQRAEAAAKKAADAKKAASKKAADAKTAASKKAADAKTAAAKKAADAKKAAAAKKATPKKVVPKKVTPKKAAPKKNVVAVSSAANLKTMVKSKKVQVNTVFKMSGTCYKLTNAASVKYSKVTC